MYADDQYQSFAIESFHVKLGEDAPEPGYAWIIGEEESRRISELLGQDIRETEFVGMYLSAPPLPCPHCGKDTEVIDWSVPHPSCPCSAY